MPKFYLVLDANNRVVGAQVSPAEINAANYVEVDEAAYSQYAGLQGKEQMFYDKTSQTATVEADPRPVFRITSAQKLEKVGVRVSIQAKQLSPGNPEELLEVSCPDGRVGLIRAVFTDGEAECGFTPDKPGYYYFNDTDKYKVEDVLSIAVYEE